MFTKILINNLRGIDHLDISDLSRINIFVGPNNSGKTTILEAIFLLLGMSNPKLVVNINNFRELIVNEKDDFSLIFKNMDLKNTICLSADDNADGDRELEISPIISDGIAKVISDSIPDGFSGQKKLSKTFDTGNTDSETYIDDLVIGLQSKFRKQNGKKKSYTSKLELDRNGLNVIIDSDYKEKLKGKFFNNRTLYGNLPDRINLIQKAKRKEQLIRFLKVIDTKVEDIALSHTGLVYVDIGLNQMIPINLMGDGFRKICAVIANLSVLQDGYLIIDEIENGLHYKSLNILWKAMIEASNETKNQIFLATHSYEAIKVLIHVLKNYQNNKNDIRIYSIQKTNEGIHKSYKYEFENLEASIGSDIEIRG
jgi:AAA15 family ATPase/GTPase